MSVARMCVALDAVRLEVDVLARAYSDREFLVLRQRVNTAIETAHGLLLEGVPDETAA